MARARVRIARIARLRPTAPTVALAALLLGGLVLRALAAHAVHFPQVDGIRYMEQARQIVETGRLPHTVFPPGWPLVIASVLTVSGGREPMDLLRAAQLANVLLGTAFGLLAFLAARTRLRAGPALAVAAVVLFLPHDVFFSKVDLSEMAYGCAVLAAWLLWHRRRLLATGLALGYAYLVRPEALLIAAAVAVVAWLDRRAPPWRFATGLLLLVAPYVLFLYAGTGRLALSGKAYLLEQTVQGHTGAPVADLLWSNVRTFYPRLPGLLGLPVVLLFLVGAVRRPGRWLLFLLPLLIVPIFPIGMRPRFWLPYLPFVLLGAGLGWRVVADAIGRRLAGGRRRLALAGMATLVAGGLGLAVADDAFLITKRQEVYPNLKVAGEWLRERVRPSTIVAAYKQQPSFWAGCDFVQVPEGTDPRAILAELRDEGAQYLVVDVFTAMLWRPALMQLMRRDLPPELAGEVTPLHVWLYEKDYRMNTAVFRIERPGGGAALQPAEG